jgi:hypothetical protein
MSDDTAEETNRENAMPRYVIEREVPGAGQLSAEELRSISRQSVGIIKEIGQGLTWLHTYVAADKMYCVYEAPNEALIREHARCMGIPATVISEVPVVIDPSTAET